MPQVDDGPSISQLWGLSWLLGIAGLAGWVTLVAQLGGGAWSAKAAVALAVAVTCTVFSACCAVLVGVKSVELRLRHDSRSPVRDVPG